MGHAGILLDTHDEVLVDGQPWRADLVLPSSLVEKEASTYDRGLCVGQPAHRTCAAARAVLGADCVHEGDARYTVDTTAQTIGEALRKSGVILYLGDRVQPSLGSAITANLHVYIQCSVPVLLQVDGRLVKTRTQAQTVVDVLSDLGIILSGGDRVEPALDAKLYDNLKIAITRVSEDVTVEEEIAPFDTVFVADPNLPIDTQEVLAVGAEGITRTRYRTQYEKRRTAHAVPLKTPGWRRNRLTAALPTDRRSSRGLRRWRMAR